MRRLGTRTINDAVAGSGCGYRPRRRIARPVLKPRVPKKLTCAMARRRGWRRSCNRRRNRRWCRSRSRSWRWSGGWLRGGGGSWVWRGCRSWSGGWSRCRCRSGRRLRSRGGGRSRGRSWGCSRRRGWGRGTQRGGDRLGKADTSAGNLLANYRNRGILISRALGSRSRGWNAVVGGALGECMRLNRPCLRRNLRFSLSRGNLRGKGVGKGGWIGGYFRNQRRVPGVMETRGHSIDDYLFSVASSIVTASGGMQGLMNVTDEVNQESQGLQASLVGLRGVRQDLAKVCDLGEHAIVGAGGGEIGGAGIGQWNRNIDKVPGRGAAGRVRVGEHDRAVGIERAAATLKI